MPLLAAVDPGALHVVSLPAPAPLPALRLGQRYQRALGMQLPEAAGGSQVIEEGTNAGLTFAHGVKTYGRQLPAVGADRAPKVLTVHGQGCGFDAGVSHPVILSHIGRRLQAL